jgi:hypothetical protein
MAGFVVTHLVESQLAGGNGLMKGTMYLAAALILTSMMAASAAGLVASDSASNPAYTSGWAAGSNGGSGFGPWDFTKSAYYSGLGPAAWGDQTHFIDNAPVAFNSLGAPAFAISADDCSYCGVYSSATRPFASSLAIGETFSMDFDNPLLSSPDFNSQNNIISFSDSAGVEVLGVFGSNYFDGQNWNFSGGGGSLGITDAATSGGSRISLTKTGANTATVVFNGTTFTNVALAGTGVIAAVTINIGNTIASNGDGSREFFVNNLRIVPEPTSVALLFVAGCGFVTSVRRRK